MQDFQKKLNFQISHIGINDTSNDEAMKTILLFEKMFGFSVTDGKDSVFISDRVEMMKGHSRGTHGHIAIGTSDIGCALNYLQQQEYEFDMDSKKYDGDGKLTVVYFKEEYSGFAVHLLQV